MLYNLLDTLREALAKFIPALRREQPDTDPVRDKLGDLNWRDTEDEETARRQSAGSDTKGDALGQTIYMGRPRNPLADD